MKDRIKAIRKELKMTQQEFADKLRIKRDPISNYEIGRSEPSDAVISLICREFNVDEVWLRTGVGEMFKERTRADEVAAYLGQLLGGHRTPIEEAFIAVMARTTPEQWELAYQKILELHEEITKIKGEKE